MMKLRGSGILLHITSLPSICGIGGLGPWAYKFADFLCQARQSFWQILPLNPVGPGSCNSPYSSLSAFGLNRLLISVELLIQDGLISSDQLKAADDFSPERVDYSRAAQFKNDMLELAYQNFKQKPIDCEFEDFCKDNTSWLDDFALFMVLSEHFNWQSWDKWPVPIRDRRPDELNSVRRQYSEKIRKEKFIQYLFHKQWMALKKYCNSRGIMIIGDIPIYMDYNSVDVWANSGIFKLNDAKLPSVVAGVPPDYFSTTGQRWGNPVYNWEVLKQENYRWWVDRIAHNLKFFDMVRVDHFRGFISYWEVPASEPTAVNGKWVDGPGGHLFNVLLRRFSNLPIIAEDLGLITPDVREAMNRYGFPGMKVLLFAFDQFMPHNPYIPHNVPTDSIVYTGTHDNNTVRGWFEKDAGADDRNRLASYLGFTPKAETVNWDFIRLAMMSVGNTVIIPMQDVLGLDDKSRMNMPSTCEGNWTWRLQPAQLTPELTKRLAEMTATYGRD